MKRVIIGVLVLLMCISLAACAGATPAEDFDYEMVNGEIAITGYNGTDREIVIPNEIEKRPVTTIGEEAFKGYDLTSIKFPKTVVTIGEYAFSDCSCLEAVSLHDGMKRLERGAFYDCDALTDVKINEKLEYLGYGSFGDCDNLKELELPDNFTGFAMEYKQKYVYEDGVGVYAAEEGDAILDPVLSGETVLVVKEGSLAHNHLLAGAWFDPINFIVK